MCAFSEALRTVLKSIREVGVSDVETNGRTAGGAITTGEIARMILDSWEPFLMRRRRQGAGRGLYIGPLAPASALTLLLMF